MNQTLSGLFFKKTKAFTWGGIGIPGKNNPGYREPELNRNPAGINISNREDGNALFCSMGTIGIAIIPEKFLPLTVW